MSVYAWAALFVFMVFIALPITGMCIAITRSVHAGKRAEAQPPLVEQSAYTARNVRFEPTAEFDVPFDQHATELTNADHRIMNGEST